MVAIPGLPKELREVPPSPNGPDDPHAGEKRERWHEWRRDIMRYRIDRRQELAATPALRDYELARIALHPAYLIATWLTIVEPRRRSAGVGSIPFIPFETQVTTINALLGSLDQEDEKADVVHSKCRGWGATWIYSAVAIWGWLTQDPFYALLLSRTEDDATGIAHRSLFAKMLRMLTELPPFLLPSGFVWSEHSRRGWLINPANGNELTGDSTTGDAGRGDRATVGIIDEAAAIRSLIEMWSTLAETTDHRWAVSTESFKHGTDFEQIKEGGDQGATPTVITSDWWENPMNDGAWFERQKKRYAANPAKFAIEILRNPRADDSIWVYPEAQKIEPDPSVVPVLGRMSYVTVDPGWKDRMVLIATQENEETGGIDVLGSYANAKKPAVYYVPLLKPELFGVGWEYASRIDWTPRGIPGIEEVTYWYDDRAIDFARLMQDMTIKPTVVGDTYGDNVTGATADSVYSVWRKFGLSVHRDRRGEKMLTMYQKQARTGRGKREALTERLPNWRFATTPSARVVLSALRNNRYEEEPLRGVTEIRAPRHDDTSHYATACEYLAVYLKYRHAIATRTLAQSVASKFGFAGVR